MAAMTAGDAVQGEVEPRLAFDVADVVGLVPVDLVAGRQHAQAGDHALGVRLGAQCAQGVEDPRHPGRRVIHVEHRRRHRTQHGIDQHHPANRMLRREHPRDVRAVPSPVAIDPVVHRPGTSRASGRNGITVSSRSVGMVRGPSGVASSWHRRGDVDVCLHGAH